MKRTTSYKLSDMTLAQIEELTALKHMSRTELLAVAVDRMYQQEMAKEQAKHEKPTD